jgi:hypothetical protein
MHAKDLILPRDGGRGQLQRQRDPANAAAPPHGQPPAREIDDDAAHDPAGPVHEVNAILDPKPAGLREPEVGLVHQRGGVEQRVPASRAKPAASQGSKIRIGCGEETVGRRGVAVPGSLDQVRQVDGLLRYDFFFLSPITQRFVVVRMKIWPSEIAGDERQ